MPFARKVLVFGAIVAGLAAAFGFGNSWRLKQVENQLVGACLAENEKHRSADAEHSEPSLAHLSDEAIVALAKEKGVNVFNLFEQRDAQQEAIKKGWNISATGKPPSEGDIALKDPSRVDWTWEQCDVEEIAASKLNQGMQAAILRAHDRQRNSRQWIVPAVLGVLILSAVPSLWYFLLRRLAEVRAALSGKSPEH